MSVSATEGDIPKFFVGCEESDEGLDQDKAENVENIYDHIDDEDDDDDEEYDSVCIVNLNVCYFLF